MAEINSNAGHGRQKGGVRRSKKLSTKVDLTPMVDLGFLLITFFVFTASMSKPKTMPLILPAGESPEINVGESTTLTLIPLSDNKVFYYHGTLEKALSMNLYGVTTFSLKNGAGDIIRQKLMALDKSSKFKRKDMMLIIKPSENASYENVVHALDEVLINVVPHYAIVDMESFEKDLLVKQGLQ